MALVRWEPFEPFKDIEKFFGEEFSFLPLLPTPKLGWDLAVDLYEDKGNIVAEMNLPGISPEKVEVTFQNGDLKIVGSRDEEKQTKETNYYCKEIRRGMFERLVKLPAGVKPEKAEATFKNGVLKVVIPKKEEATEKIKVKIQ